MYTIKSERSFTVREQNYAGTSLTAIIDTTQYRMLAYCDGIKLIKPSCNISLELIAIDLFKLTLSDLLWENHYINHAGFCSIINYLYAQYSIVI